VDHRSDRRDRRRREHARDRLSSAMKDTSVAEDVTHAAVELFAAQGYAKTSVQQIVDAAGVTKGAMYHYFESKDDLLFPICERMLWLQKSHLDEKARRDAASALHSAAQIRRFDRIRTFRGESVLMRPNLLISSARGGISRAARRGRGSPGALRPVRRRCAATGCPRRARPAACRMRLLPRRTPGSRGR
jgi:AcrR family transcriptional regulator